MRTLESPAIDAARKALEKEMDDEFERRFPSDGNSFLQLLDENNKVLAEKAISYIRCSGIRFRRSKIGRTIEVIQEGTVVKCGILNKKTGDFYEVEANFNTRHVDPSVPIHMDWSGGV